MAESVVRYRVIGIIVCFAVEWRQPS